MDIKVKEKAAWISMASMEANPEGTDSWRLSANSTPQAWKANCFWWAFRVAHLHGYLYVNRSTLILKERSVRDMWSVAVLPSIWSSARSCWVYGLSAELQHSGPLSLLMNISPQGHKLYHNYLCILSYFQEKCLVWDVGQWPLLNWARIPT